MLSSRSDAVDGVTLNRRIVAEAFEPRNFWLASKPCHLPLCVVSVGLLRRLQRLLSRQLGHAAIERPAYNRGKLVGRAFGPYFAISLFRFLDEAGFKHLDRTPVDSLVERRAIRIQSESKDAESFAADRVPAATTPTSFPSRSQADFNRPDELRDIVGMHPLRRGPIEPLENLMQIFGPAIASPLAQSLPQFLGPLRTREKSFEQSPQIESRASDHDRQPVSRLDFPQDPARLARIFSGSHSCVGSTKSNK